jgi:hypothetical protein
LFGDKYNQFVVAANTKEIGDMELYNKENGWFEDNPVVLEYKGVDGLAITNGKSTVIDRFPLDGFNIGSVTVYGKDDSRLPDK